MAEPQKLQRSPAEQRPPGLRHCHTDGSGSDLLMSYGAPLPAEDGRVVRLSTSNRLQAPAKDQSVRSAMYAAVGVAELKARKRSQQSSVVDFQDLHGSPEVSPPATPKAGNSPPPAPVVSPPTGVLTFPMSPITNPDVATATSSSLLSAPPQDIDRQPLRRASSCLRGVGGNFLDGSSEKRNRKSVKGMLGEDTGLARLARLRGVFDQIDVDGSGSVDVKEFHHALELVGVVGATLEDTEQVVREVDRNSNGIVEFDDFVRFFDLWDAIQENRGAKLAKALREERERRDKEADGYTTDRRADARRRVQELLYDLPTLAPDYTPRRWWDFAVSMVAVYHCLVGSLTLFHPIGMDGDNSWFFGVEAAATCVLVADIVVSLNTAVVVPGQFRLQTSRGDIARRYIRGYFWVDVPAALPADLVYLIAGGHSHSMWSFLRALRLLKMLKLPALFRMTDRGVMDSSFVRFYCWYVPLWNKLLWLILWAHVLALARMFLGGHDTDPEHTCDPLGRDVCASNAATRWGYSLFWMWSLTLGQGLSAMETTVVRGFGCVVFLVSLLVQGHVMAQMSAIFIKSNVAQVKVDSMRKVFADLKFYRIPKALQEEVLGFNFHILNQNAVAPLAQTLSLLPASMQQEVGLFVRVTLVSEVPMFKDLSNECRQALAGSLHQVFLEPEDNIIEFGAVGSEMYFIMHGFAEVLIPVDPTDPYNGEEIHVAVVKPGDFFGEVALLIPGANRTATIKSLTYCDLFRLDTCDFVALFYRFAELSIKMEAEAHNRGLLRRNGDTPSTKQVALLPPTVSIEAPQLTIEAPDCDLLCPTVTNSGSDGAKGMQWDPRRPSNVSTTSTKSTSDNLASSRHSMLSESDQCPRRVDSTGSLFGNIAQVVPRRRASCSSEARGSVAQERQSIAHRQSLAASSRQSRGSVLDSLPRRLLTKRRSGAPSSNSPQLGPAPPPVVDDAKRMSLCASIPHATSVVFPGSPASPASPTASVGPLLGSGGVAQAYKAGHVSQRRMSSAVLSAASRMSAAARPKTANNESLLLSSYDSVVSGHRVDGSSPAPTPTSGPSPQSALLGESCRRGFDSPIMTPRAQNTNSSNNTRPAPGRRRQTVSSHGSGGSAKSHRSSVKLSHVNTSDGSDSFPPSPRSAAGSDGGRSMPRVMSGGLPKSPRGVLRRSPSGRNGPGGGLFPAQDPDLFVHAVEGLLPPGPPPPPPRPSPMSDFESKPVAAELPGLVPVAVEAAGLSPLARTGIFTRDHALDEHENVSVLDNIMGKGPSRGVGRGKGRSKGGGRPQQLDFVPLPKKLVLPSAAAAADFSARLQSTLKRVSLRSANRAKRRQMAAQEQWTLLRARARRLDEVLEHAMRRAIVRAQQLAQPSVLSGPSQPAPQNAGGGDHFGFSKF
eukprot:TRINITY_DN2589_c5_g1_i1.p1 TRINITY_DN2589_c5_g1~~TRINITY_DN2589_c5_g1_i1.p1  ORF type:complete len:1395 (+),score=271.87 TRINITY_DN2589_c5_g1_i1:120-4304(+)